MTLISGASLGIFMLCQVVGEPWYHIAKKLYTLYPCTLVLPMNKTKTVVISKIFLSLIHSMRHFSTLQKPVGVQLRLKYAADMLTMSEEWELWLEVFSSV